jgi:hypothetical protein
MMTIAPGEDRENASLFPQYKTLPKFGSRHLLKSLLSLSGCHPFKRLEYEFCRLKKQWYTAWRHARESVGADGKKWHSHFNKMQDAMTQALEISLDKPGFLLSMDQPGFPWVTVMIFMITYTLLCA